MHGSLFWASRWSVVVGRWVTGYVGPFTGQGSGYVTMISSYIADLIKLSRLLCLCASLSWAVMAGVVRRYKMIPEQSSFANIVKPWCLRPSTSVA